MKKTYILDTSVFIHDPDVIEKFEDNDLVIPIAVIEELDGLKRGQGEVPYSARRSLKLIDRFLKDCTGGNAAALQTGGTVRIELGGDEMAVSADDRIISAAVRIKRLNNTRAVLVSKDTAVRIKAVSFGVEAEDYRNDRSVISQFFGKVLSDNDENTTAGSVRYKQSSKKLYRINPSGDYVQVERKKEVSGITGKNIEQECAVDALVSPEIEAVALTGKAGTGKTLLALAAGLHMFERSIYEQIMVARPVVPLGNDIGFLPGEVQDKLRPWMQPIFDNLEIIVNTPKDHKDNKKVGNYKSYNSLSRPG